MPQTDAPRLDVMVKLSDIHRAVVACSAENRAVAAELLRVSAEVRELADLLREQHTERHPTPDSRPLPARYRDRRRPA